MNMEAEELILEFSKWFFSFYDGFVTKLKTCPQLGRQQRGPNFLILLSDFETCPNILSKLYDPPKIYMLT
jgi:hypothetical protein